MSFLKDFFCCLLGVLFIAAGINHFWHTAFYVAMMPPYLPRHLELVYASGLSEMALGVLVLFRRWRGAAGWGIILLCVAVFPANLYMAQNPALFSQFTPAGLWLRLPLQAVVIAWAYWATRPTAPVPAEVR